jgi:hypothetical protein
VDSFAVTAGVPLDLITGLCDFVTVGNQFTQVCHDTLENSATCLLVQTLTGSGTVTGNYFSGTWTLTYQKTGSCLAWEPVPNCTFRIVGNGTKVPGTGPVLTYRSLPEALTRLMRRRFVADP